jgi:hypothetical protein
MYSGIFEKELKKREAVEEFLRDVRIPDEILVPGERFARELRRGEEIEEKIAEALGFTYEKTKNKDKDSKYDLKVKLGAAMLRLEIKDESNYSESGNLCIEVSKGKKGEEETAGLTATLSDFMIHYFSDDEIYIYESLAMLANLAEEHDKYLRYNLSGENNSNGYVLPKKVALQMPTVRKTTLGELEKTIEKGLETWI